VLVCDVGCWRSLLGYNGWIDLRKLKTLTYFVLYFAVLKVLHVFKFVV
jgi:hypothetical protein